MTIISSTMLPPASSSSSLSLAGQLFTYGSNRVAFESFAALASIPSSSSIVALSHQQSESILPPNKCILLGGLSDGLLPVPYTHALSEMLCQFPYENSSSVVESRDSAAPPPPEQTWSLVQPILSSSYTGFGHGTLDRDVMELQELIQYLYQNRNAVQNIVLLGHSTGCQQIVHYFQKYENQHVTAAVLQAPVSDREAAAIWSPNGDSPYQNEHEHQEQLQKHIALAIEMKEKQDRGHEMMPRSAFWAPITAQRYYDLMVRGNGLDDYFSSDYSDAELQSRLSHISSSSVLRRVIVAYSGQDEYVPQHIDTKVLLQRLCDAMNNNIHPKDVTQTPSTVAQPLYLPHGNHNLSSTHPPPLGATAVTTFLQRIYTLLVELTATTTIP